MLKIITWSIVVLLMTILAIIDFSTGNIIAGVICILAVICDVGVVGLSIADYRHIKELKKKCETSNIKNNNIWEDKT